MYDESLVLSLGYLCTAISWREGLAFKEGIVTDCGLCVVQGGAVARAKPVNFWLWL